MHYVIIGNSTAAIGCIEGIRSVDENGPITVISDEPYPAYSRPLISYLLYGSTTEEKMRTRPADFYETQKVHKKQYEELMVLSSKEVSVLRNRLGIMQIEGSQRIVLSDMVEKAIKLYEDKMITFERLEYLLSMSKLTIEKVGIEENKGDIPSMNEIDQIMEEEDKI